MNPRRLEIFYHVVRFGGIAAAARHMAQRLDLTSVSKHITLLEEEVGFRLFERRPFRLTKEGRILYESLPGMHATLTGVLKQLERRREPWFRIGVEDGLRQSILVPAAADWLKLEPHTKAELQTGSAPRLHQALAEEEIDLLIALLDCDERGGKSEGRRQKTAISAPSPAHRRESGAIRSRTLGTRPLVLLVPKSSGIRSAEHFWRQKTITERLVTPAGSHPVVQSLHRGLSRGGLTWPAQIVTDSILSVLPFVSEGLGVGITFDLPGNTRHPKVRALPVAGFDPVTIACHWRAPDTARLQTALQLVAQHAR